MADVLSRDPAQLHADPLLRLTKISRSFGAVRAVQGVDLAVFAGRIHALLGENGAGKSTLMNVVYGIHAADSGTVEVAGRPVVIRSPRDAIAQRIAMVHQHDKLISALTIAESLTLASGNAPLRIDRKRSAARVARLGRELNLTLNPDTRVRDLSLADRQRVEILAAVDRDARIIILDEPTAVLAPTEVASLFDLIRGLAAGGRAVILITHRMREVFDVSDDISVMRKGQLVATLETARTNRHDVLDLVIPQQADAETSAGMTADSGATVEKTSAARPTKPANAAAVSEENGQPVLQVSSLAVPPAAGRTGLKDLTFTVRSGEILGIIGVDGNGQHELAEVLAGVRRPVDGAVIAFGEKQTPLRPAPHTIVIPEDRHREALVLDLSNEENYILPILRHYTKRGFVRRREARRDACAAITDFRIATSSSAARSRSMSGGNQQKLVLARAIAQRPRLIVASNATRGLDPGAAGEVLRRLRDAASQGASVLFIGSDLDEVIEVSDRVLALYDGSIVAESAAPEDDRDRLAAGMVGETA